MEKSERLSRWATAVNAKLVPEEDQEAYNTAKAKWQNELAEEISLKYCTDEIYEEACRILGYIDEEEDVEARETKIAEADVIAHKAKRAHKALTRMYLYQTVKAEVLLNQDYTCPCCERKFPSKEEHAAKNSGEKYPLYVRCNFPIVKYIEHKGQFDPKQLLGEEKIFDPHNYTAVCNECKPMSFK